MRVALALALCAAVAAAETKPVVVTPAEAAAARIIREELLKAHIRFLSSDLLEGRSPASRGDALAQAYIAAQMEAIGMQPGAPDGTWVQRFEIVGLDSHSPRTVEFSRGDERLELRCFEDFIAFSGVQQEEVRLQAAEVVFVGYGIVAPEYDWDDYKRADLRGKVLLMMNNDPADDPALFGGKARLYYGRWSYKYEQAARMGAAGAIIVHTTPSAAYPWTVVQSSWSGEQFSLAEPETPEVTLKAWATEDASRRIARLGGQDLDALRAAAERRDFKPVPLGVTLSITLRNALRRQTTANVIGRLPGRDPQLARQALLYTAHFDHLGLKQGARPGEDAIYNGARDNASGVAGMLAVAQAMAALPRPPRRTVYFGAVAGEEQGLLGSRYLASHPPLPVGRIAADVNLDTLGVWGPTRDLVMVGLGRSDVDDVVLGLAAALGREVGPDPQPDKGYFYRSDQFSFAQVGVPAAYFGPGVEAIGKPAGWGREREQAFEKSYHQPSDEPRPDWDLGGAIEDLRFALLLGLKLADADALPAWRQGDEFEAARKQALQEAAASAAR